MQTDMKKLQEEKVALENDKEKLIYELAICKDAFSEKKAQFAQVLTDLAETREKLQKINPSSQPSRTISHFSQSSGNEQSIHTNNDKDTQSGNSNWSLTVMDEMGNQSNSLHVSVQDQEREQKLRKFYEEKFALLESQLQQTDAKLIDLLSRKDSLEQNLQQTKDERDMILDQLRLAKSSLSQSSELLETTRKNYQQQLRDLSDHFIDLQEKISKSSETLEMIKKWKVRCGKCKTWNTIEWLMTDGQNGLYCSKGNHPSSLNYA
jgi:chromosome segregation ATPase